MRAEIFKIEKDSIKAVTSKDKLVTIPKSKISFKCKVGDFIIIERKNNRSYYSLANSVTKRKNGRTKPKNRKIKITIVLAIILLIAGLITTIIIAPKIVKENLNNQLSNCITDGYKKLRPNGFLDNADAIVKNMLRDTVVDETLINEQDMAIACYNKYQTDNYKEKIDEISYYKKRASLSICVRNAKNNSAISTEEINNANTIAQSIALLTRLSNGYQEQINCYQKYDVEESESKISELKIKKSETDSYIESAKNSTINNIRTGLYCATNTIGNYTYTNCY